MSDLTWTTKQMRLGDLQEWGRNPRQLSEHDAKHIGRSIETFGLADPLIINADGQLIGGHQRKRVMMLNGATADTLVDVRVPSRQLTEDEAAELNIRLNRNSGEWDWDTLADEFEVTDLLDWGFTEFDLVGVDYEHPKLVESIERIRQRSMFRVLISVPVDMALDIRHIVEEAATVEGVEIDYGANG